MTTSGGKYQWMRDPDIKFLFSNPVHWVSLGLGAGLSPVAPGTLGTVVGVGLYFLVSEWSLPLYLLLVAVLFFAGCLAAGFTSRKLGAHDHGSIVIDEIVGMLLALAHCPAGLGWVLLAFLLFRALDILKPWPIGVIDRRAPGGAGIMLDDLAAGAYALIAIQTANFLTA